jgi:hypothetical protein
LIDQSLRWWPHIQHIQGKTRITIQALRSLAGSTWGAALTTLRRVYLAKVIPQITYGFSVWYTPHGEKGHTAKMCAKLDKIQLEATRIVGGAYRATSAVALNIELFFLPMRQQLEKRARETVLNIRSGSWDPGSGNAYPRKPQTGRGPTRRQPLQTSPFARISRSLEKKLGTETLMSLETRQPFIVEPWWSPPSNLHRARPGDGRTTT